MFGKSWTRVSSWLRKQDTEKVGRVILVVLIYFVLACGAAFASILWRIV